MTREEAYSRIKEVKDSAWGWHMGGEVLGIPYNEFCEIMSVAISALKGPTREMVERMRGEWEAVPRFGVYDTACSKCGYSPGIRFFSSDFCPACGAPMTDEAVDMLANRLEEVLEGME